MVQNIGHFFDHELPEPEAPMRDITVADAIRLLRLYERREREQGRELKIADPKRELRVSSPH